MKTFWQIANKYPPCLVRLLARHKNGPPLTTSEIVQRCAQQGWPMSSYRVGLISSSLSWHDIPLGEMRTFLVACGMDFCNPEEMQRKRVYLGTQNKFKYLHDSPEWETVLRPLVMRFRESQEVK